jgi:hypothetical protein
MKRADEILDGAKRLTRGVNMRVCNDGIFCRDETHDPGLVGIAKELGAEEKPIVGFGPKGDW